VGVCVFQMFLSSWDAASGVAEEPWTWGTFRKWQPSPPQSPSTRLLPSVDSCQLWLSHKSRVVPPYMEGVSVLCVSCFHGKQISRILKGHCHQQQRVEPLAASYLKALKMKTTLTIEVVIWRNYCLLKARTTTHLNYMYYCFIHLCNWIKILSYRKEVGGGWRGGGPNNVYTWVNVKMIKKKWKQKLAWNCQKQNKTVYEEQDSRVHLK
jgi:hypothetical protein